MCFRKICKRVVSKWSKNNYCFYDQFGGGFSWAVDEMEKLERLRWRSISWLVSWVDQYPNGSKGKRKRETISGDYLECIGSMEMSILFNAFKVSN